MDGTPLVEVSFAAPPTPPPAPAIRISAARPRLSDADRPQAPAADAARFRSLSGTVLDDRYEIGQKIGEGGMSWVYRAVERGTGADLAIKVLPPRLTRDRDSAERLRREAEIATRFDHPNVCPILRLGEAADGVLYLVMPFLPGETLGDYEGRVRDVDVAEGVRILVQVCHGLQHAHDLGVIHRDLKPENVMLRADRSVALADFGVAKSLEQPDVLGLTQTRHGEVVGTPYYLSPEQASGRPITPATDLYSLGVMFYEMLTGSRPYSAESLDLLLARHLTAPVPQLPAEFGGLQSILDKLMAKAPEDRHPSARALLDQLAELPLLRTAPSGRGGSSAV